MVSKITGDPLDSYILHTVITQNTGCSVGTSDFTHGILRGISLESTFYGRTGPQRKDQAGEDKKKICPIKTVIITIIGHKIPPFSSLIIPNIPTVGNTDSAYSVL